MCIAVPSRIEKITGNNAVVNYGGITLEVNIMFIDNPQIGDYVLIHAGCAIQKIDEKYALETLEIFNELSDAIRECEVSGCFKED